MRIGIVGDSALTELLRSALALAAEHQVLWTATTESELASRCLEPKPDLVLVDVHMRGLNGLEAVRRVAAETSCPVLVTVAGSAEPGRVFEALGQGALDAVDLPGGVLAQASEIMTPLLAKVATIGRLIGKNPRVRSNGDDAAECSHLIAIGASAGGPAALAEVLPGLPHDIRAAVVIVQHLGQDFTTGVAEWLQRSTPLQVRVAREGDRPTPGVVLVAGGNEHLVFKSGGRVGYTAEPREKIYRPSIDVFFESVGRLWQGTVVGVLLTGMGRDGAQGLKGLRGLGHHTIAQDEASCAVYGMPKAAAALDAAVEILPLEQIGIRLRDVVAAQPSRTPKFVSTR